MNFILPLLVIITTLGLTVYVLQWSRLAQQSAGSAAAPAITYGAAAPATPLKPQGLHHVTFTGRWYDTAQGKTGSWGVLIFHLAFTGSSVLSVKLSETGLDSGLSSGLYYTCSGTALGNEKIVQASAFVGPLASGLDAAASYTLSCGRNTEASFGRTTVEEVLLESGGLVLAPTSPTGLRYMSLGDSIAAGMHTLRGAVALGAAGGSVPSAQEVAANENVFESYSRHLADAWATTDWRVVARSGISVVQFGWDEKPFADLFLCRDYVNGRENCSTPWDFSFWKADVVTINLGTNDFSFPNKLLGNQSRSVQHPMYPSLATFRAAYQSLIDLVRRSYGQSALIFCISPLISSYLLSSLFDPGIGFDTLPLVAQQKVLREMQAQVDTGQFGSLPLAIQQAVQAKAGSGDTLVRFVPTIDPLQPWLRKDDYYDMVHPLASGHRKFAAMLLKTMTPQICEVFPQKCPLGEHQGAADLRAHQSR